MEAKLRSPTPQKVLSSSRRGTAETGDTKTGVDREKDKPVSRRGKVELKNRPDEKALACELTYE